MVRAVILGGGNVGDARATLEGVSHILEERVGHVEAMSGLYRSRSWGFDAEDFWNCTYVVETSLGAEELLETLLSIEATMGRNREEEARAKAASGERYASRRLDLDILFYGEERLMGERLTIPHPRIMEREFAIIPTCEALGIGRSELEDKIKRIKRR